MSNKRFKKPAILVFASLLAMTSGSLRADHDIDLITPLVTVIAAGALLSYHRSSQHYYHYYSYRSQSRYHGGHSSHGHGHGHGHGYKSHGYSKHGYKSHGYSRHGHGSHGYSKRQSSHGHYAGSKRHSSSAGGYHTPRRKH